MTMWSNKLVDLVVERSIFYTCYFITPSPPIVFVGSSFISVAPSYWSTETCFLHQAVLPPPPIVFVWPIIISITPSYCSAVTCFLHQQAVLLVVRKLPHREALSASLQRAFSLQADTFLPRLCLPGLPSELKGFLSRLALTSPLLSRCSLMLLSRENSKESTRRCPNG